MRALGQLDRVLTTLGWRRIQQCLVPQHSAALQVDNQASLSTNLDCPFEGKTKIKSAKAEDGNLAGEAIISKEVSQGYAGTAHDLVDARSCSRIERPRELMLEARSSYTATWACR